MCFIQAAKAKASVVREAECSCSSDGTLPELGFISEQFDVVTTDNSTSPASPSIMKEPGSAGSGNKVQRNFDYIN